VGTLQATEKGYKVGVLETGKRWPDEVIPEDDLMSTRFRLAARRPKFYGMQLSSHFLSLRAFGCQSCQWPKDTDFDKAL
jgi:hypothetical protein